MLRAGGVAEWSIAAVLKTVERESVPWVRIPPPPPVASSNVLLLLSYIQTLESLPPILPTVRSSPNRWFGALLRVENVEARGVCR